MLLVNVAILTLLHPQEVSVNGVTLTRRGMQVESAGRLQASFRFPGPVRVNVKPDFQRTYRGSLQVRVRNSELQLILTTSEEELVAATVSAESPPGALPAALQAQAIVARSWIRASQGRHGEFDLCDTTHCQHFKEPLPTGVAAAKETAGLVLAWQEKVFAPAYSASCGGRAKTAAAIGWDDHNVYPYFEVDCPVCRRDEQTWIRRLNPDDAADVRANPNRESARLKIGRRSGWAALPSNNYELDGVTAKGRGRGHGLGLCQMGAAGMARTGASAAEILRHYFPGTNIISSR